MRRRNEPVELRTYGRTGRRTDWRTDGLSYRGASRQKAKRLIQKILIPVCNASDFLLGKLSSALQSKFRTLISLAHQRKTAKASFVQHFVLMHQNIPLIMCMSSNGLGFNEKNNTHIIDPITQPQTCKDIYISTHSLEHTNTHSKSNS